MGKRFISSVLILLLFLSVTVPTVSAEPVPIESAGQNPVGNPAVVVPIVIDGMEYLLSITAVVTIGAFLGLVWDSATETLDYFVLCVQDALDDLFNAKAWYYVSSDEGQALIETAHNCYYCDASGRSKEDCKCYFEARLSGNDVKICSIPLNETQAVQKMNLGKNIMTVDETLADNVVMRFIETGTSPQRWVNLVAEIHHDGADGNYYHLHYGRNSDERLHCWMWFDPPLPSL